MLCRKHRCPFPPLIKLSFKWNWTKAQLGFCACAQCWSDILTGRMSHSVGMKASSGNKSHSFWGYGRDPERTFMSYFVIKSNIWLPLDISGTRGSRLYPVIDLSSRTPVAYFCTSVVFYKSLHPPFSLCSLLQELPGSLYLAEKRKPL